MLNVGKAIYKILSDDATVSGLVGTSIFPNVVPDTDGTGQIRYPVIVFNRVGFETTTTKSCVANLDSALVEIECWSESYYEAVDIAIAIRTALESAKGTYNGVSIDRIRLVGAVEMYEVPYLQKLTFTFK